MISSTMAASMRAEVAVLAADAQAASNELPGAIDSMWADAIGASSSIEATRSLASSAQSLADAAGARAELMIADPNATDADGAAAIAAWSSGQPAAAQVSSVAELLSPAHAVGSIARATIKDAASALPHLALAGTVIALAILAILYLPRR